MKVFLCYLCLCLPFSFALQCTVTSTKSEDIYVQSPNYPDEKNTQSCDYQFAVEEGYPIEIIAEDIEFTGIDTFLEFRPANDEKIYKIVRYLKTPKKYIIDQSSISFIFSTKSNTGRFRIHLKRHGDLTTTTEPTTIVTWPTPVKNESIYYTVNLSISADTFKNKETDFKFLMANMSQKYCTENKILLSDNITIKNVHIETATKCSFLWPNFEECVQIQYAIPVLLLKSENYELTTENLRTMWDKLAIQYLENIGWGIYEIPDNNYTILLWITISLIILIIFFIILLFARALSIRFNRSFRRRQSDTQQIITTPKRVSDASLWPTSGQSIPPLFDNENTYTYYEPDTILQNAQIHQVSTSKMLNVDDLSDEEILTVTNNSTTPNYNQTVIYLSNEAKESAL